MKAKIVRGCGFRGALDYVLDMQNIGKQPEVVGGTLAGETAAELSREFSIVRGLRPDIKRPVWHCSLSLPADENLSSEKWSVVVEDFMQRMGFDLSTSWVAVRHKETDYDHVHIIACRVSLNSTVWLGQWDARRAIEATQELEKEHGLTLTQGLGTTRAARKTLTRGEINMAVRTGKEPLRQRLQRLVDDAVRDRPTALEFVQRLETAGVGVRANIASTGRMNGFSFELDGVAFKGQDLGNNYKWNALQKRGVSYEQARDSAELERFRSTVTSHRDSQNSTTYSDDDSGRIKESSRCDSESYYADYESSVSNQVRRESCTGRVRQSDGSTTEDAGRVDTADGGECGADVRTEIQESGGYNLKSIVESGRAAIQSQQYGKYSSADDELAGRTSNCTARYAQGSRANDKNSGRGTSQSLAASVGFDSDGSSGRDAGSIWASLLGQDDALKHRETSVRSLPVPVAQSDERRARISESDRQSARELEPTAYLEACGYNVIREGRHLSVRAGEDEAYRVTRKADGHYASCDRDGSGIGDNVALVQEIEPGTGFAEAVFRLLGAPTVCKPRPRSVEPKRASPQLPVQSSADVEWGRQYLRNRGISPDTLENAEKAGTVRYMRGGVLFVGYDSKRGVQSVTRRAIEISDPVQKRDFRGSDKRFPPILPGSPKNVWIAEGGTDALALHDLAKRTGHQPPTVIVSGGANVRGFLEREEIQSILKGARYLTVAGENEKDPETQAKTDAEHSKQAQRVAEITGHEVCQWKPTPAQGKDLAEMNARQIEREQIILQHDDLNEEDDYGTTMS